jgi:8-oxo-dGTP pyrophosphatase MutT (NUDIX family)
MKEQNPWKKLKQKVVYENSWIKVENHDVLNPAGNPGIYGTVHFKNLAIGVIVLDEEENTFLVGQYRFPIESYSWEIPEGGGIIGIEPIDTAKRELLEETGLKANKWSELLRINTSNSVTDELGIIYLAEDLEQFEANPDEDEQLVIKRIPFNEAFKMVMNGEIMDSLSMTAILKLKILLDNKKA